LIFREKDFAPAGAAKGLSDRPLETFGRISLKIAGAIRYTSETQSLLD
jgi:hypothetical protein